VKRKILFVSLIATVCIVGVFAARSKATQGQQDQSLVRITYVETARLPDGQIQTKGKRVRVVEMASGQYKETDYAPDGKERDSLLVSKKGVFVIRKDMIQPKDEFMAPPPESPEAMKKNAIGTARILNYTAYITKAPTGSVEVWTTPELGGHIPLKVIMYSGDRVSFTQLEAVEVSREGAAPAGFFDLPDLPVDTSKVEQALEASKERNDQRGVERYTQMLKKWKR
jgi:hypothetical protein